MNYFYSSLICILFFLFSLLNISAQEIIATTDEKSSTVVIKNLNAEPLLEPGHGFIINTEELFSGINTDNTKENINEKILRIDKCMNSIEDKYTDPVLEKKRITMLKDLRTRLKSGKRDLKE